jgi:5-methylcytosine-specific restriction protein A
VATYLLTWNPDKFAWDQLNTEAVRFARGEVVESNWSCGNTTSIPAGARIFMLRQGRRGRGIVASGWTIRGTFQEPHWDPQLARAGVKANYVRVRMDQLLDPEARSILDVHSIQTGPLSNVYWSRPASGTTISDNAADALELAWAEHLGVSPGIEGEPPDISALEGHILVRLVKHRAREQSLRDAKLRAARSANTDSRLRCEVPGCGFDFEEIYGALGRNYAHVHHTRPLADFDGPVLVTLADLAVVCANCHAMVHRGGECRPLHSLIVRR